MFNDNDIQFRNFITDYVDIISENYNELEKKRHSFILKVILICLPSLLLFLFGIYVLIVAAPFCIIFFTLAVIPVVFAVPYQKKYSQYIKNAVGYQILSKYFNITPMDTAPDEIIMKSELFPRGSYFQHIDDCFEGTYKNTDFQIYELMVRVDGGNNSKSQECTVFRGFILIFDNNGNLPNDIVISSKNIFVDAGIILVLVFLGLIALLSVISSAIIIFQGVDSNNEAGYIIEITILAFLSAVGWFLSKSKDRLSKIKLNSKNFMRHFNVKAKDRKEAQRMITPDFMSKMLNFRNNFGGKYISCAVCDEKVIFAVESDKDLFELGALGLPLKKSKAVYKFYNEINSIYQLMDYFKLNKNMGI